MSKQTNHLSLTYPESGDHTRIWEHMQKLATDIDGQASPTFIPLTITGFNMQAASTNKPGIQRAFGMYRLTGTVEWTGGNSLMGDQFIATMPPGMWPTNTVRAACAIANNDGRASNTVRVDVSADDGKLTVYYCAGVKGATWMSLDGPMWNVA